MSRTGLHRPRPTRALRERPATDTRLLLPSPFPPGDGRSIDSPRHTCLSGLPRGCAPLMGRLAPAMREGLFPDTVGSPEGIAPRDYSPVSRLGDPLSPGDGKESALPSLRMVERFPHTDRPQRDTPSSPADSRDWRRLAPRPLRPRHGPSIAYPPIPNLRSLLEITPMPKGGPRPGAGAPKGNLNALKHGRTSRQLKQVSRILAALPRHPEPADGVKPRKSKRRRAAGALAAHLLVSVLDRFPSRLETRDGAPISKVRELLTAASNGRTTRPLTHEKKVKNP